MYGILEETHKSFLFIAFHKQFNVLHDFLLLLQDLELLELHILVALSLALLRLYYLLDDVHLLPERLLVLQALQILVAVVTPRMHLFFLQVLFPSLSL